MIMRLELQPGVVSLGARNNPGLCSETHFGVFEQKEALVRRSILRVLSANWLTDGFPSGQNQEILRGAAQALRRF
jgi:hypothetical protein